MVKSLFTSILVLSLLMAVSAQLATQELGDALDKNRTHALRQWIYKGIKKELHGYIIGYENLSNTTLPEECLNVEFQDHFHKKLNIFLGNLFTGRNWNQFDFLNQLIGVATVAMSELMNDCNDGRVIVDTYELFSNGLSSAALKLLWHTFYQFPMIIFFDIIFIVGTIIPGLQYWGGYGLGQALRRFIAG